MSELRPAIFLDRDGTLIRDAGHISDYSQVEFFPETFPALKELQKGYLLFVVSNQSGIARGIITREQADEVNRKMDRELRSRGIEIQEWYVCPHRREDRCRCMKPGPEFLLRAAADHGADLSRSFMLGDHPHDALTGREEGVYGLYLLSGHGGKHLAGLPADHPVFHGIAEAAEWILKFPHPREDLERLIRQGAEDLKAGKTVAFPTETVYGLGADAFNPRAVDRIYAVKKRPRNNPLIVHISHRRQLARVAARVPEKAEALMEAFWPGPLTMVFPKQPEVPAGVTAGSDTVAVRMPVHPVALRLIELAGTPVAAPSANAFGCTSPTTARHVFEQLGEECGLIIDGGACRVGVESTVITFLEEVPKILRPGGITREAIEQVIGPVAVREGEAKGALESPGLLPSHYAPDTPLYMLDHVPGPGETDEHTGLILLSPPTGPLPGVVEILSESGDLSEAATNLYRAVRRLDALGLRRILTHRFPGSGLGAAINDRLEKACADKKGLNPRN